MIKSSNELALAEALNELANLVYNCTPGTRWPIFSRAYQRAESALRPYDHLAIKPLVGDLPSEGSVHLDEEAFAEVVRNLGKYKPPIV